MGSGISKARDPNGEIDKNYESSSNYTRRKELGKACRDG